MSRLADNVPVNRWGGETSGVLRRHCRIRQNAGFTLVEVITVLVILGVVAAIGSSFLISTVDSYDKTQSRAKLINKGRVAIEQMTRQLRAALPNAIRVSGSGNCIEFLPIVGGANYIGTLPDSDNGAPSVTSVTTAAFHIGLGTGRHVAVGALADGEVYTNASPSSRVAINPITGGPHTSVSFTSMHQFIRNSINRRLFITDNPKRFCVLAGNLIEYNGYNLSTGGMDDSNPGGTPATMAQNVSAGGNAFALSPGSEDRNTAILISLTFAERGEQVTLNHTVLVRNVP